MQGLFTRFSDAVSRATGSPAAFIVALTVVLIWAASGPMLKFSETWQMIINTGTTIVTFLMVFIIQAEQNRDTAALQAKLDELLRALPDANSRFIGIEHLSEQELNAIRNRLEQIPEAQGDPTP